jgi:hypothetical protein
MARRAQPKTQSGLWFTLLTLFGALGIAGAYFFQKDANPYRTLERLKAEDYLENANSLRGNTYQVEGVILNSLGSSPEKGRLFGLRLGSGGRELPVPILVPPGYRDVNLQKGQKFRIKVRVNDEGLLLVEEMTKA